MAGPKRIAALLLALGALAAPVAGCGGSEPALDPVAQAASKTAGAGSSRVAIDASIEAPGLPQPIPFTAEGAFDNRAQRGRMSLDLSSIAPIAGSRLGSPEDFRGEQVFDNFVLYLRLPFFRRAFPGAREWVKVDVAKAGQAYGFDLRQLAQYGENDPSQYLRYLRATSGKTTKVGTEAVRGIETTRYRATIDLRKYPRLAPPSERRRARAAVDRLIAASGTRTVPTEVWVDAEDLVRRIALSLSLRPQGASPVRTTTRIRIEFFDFGVKVAARRPPASKVSDLTELAGRAPRR